MPNLRHSLALLASLMLGACASLPDGPPQQVAVGRIERLGHFPSRHVAARHVEVWLPPGYSPERRYPVLYMHDGQMLFDATTTWNQQAWGVHEAIDRLARAGRIEAPIVVGVWNNGAYRHAEYFPQKFLNYFDVASREQFITNALKGEPLADRYLKFLVEELKPAIDARYATRPGRESTFLMGSSMGGLISVYGLAEHPAVFGGIAALSTHWIGIHQANEDFPALARAYLNRHLPAPGPHRIYMDTGTTELDALYPPHQAQIDLLVRGKGYPDSQFMSRVFPGEGHNETAWQRRLAIPLEFLFGPRPGGS